MTNNQNLIIIGASGHGKVVAEIAKLSNSYREIYFMDDNLKEKNIYGYKNLGGAKEINKYKKNADFFVAIGNNTVRMQKIRELKSHNANIPTLIHPKAIVSESARIGYGSVVMAGAIINPSVKVGVGTIINSNSSVDHDSSLGDFTHISPGVVLAGNVKIGDLCWIGIGSTVINNIYITDKTIIGAGGCVIRDIVNEGTYVGVPVKKSDIKD